jgi:phage FluMu protein Com
MATRYKPALAVLHEDMIFLECPFCGKTLIRANIQKIRSLLQEEDMPRGKICPKCKDVAVFKWRGKIKQAIQERLAQYTPSRSEAPTVRMEDLT